MYCFPSVTMPEGAIQDAEKLGMTPDTLYLLTRQYEQAHCLLLYAVASAVLAKCLHTCFSNIKRSGALRHGSEIDFEIDKFLRNPLKCRLFPRIVSGAVTGHLAVEIIEEAVKDIITNAIGRGFGRIRVQCHCIISLQRDHATIELL
jgi:hypothetical protein